MKEFRSIREQIDYYVRTYKFYPPRDFNDLLNQFKSIGEKNPEDALPFLHTWKLIEDHENKFVMTCRTGSYHTFYYEIFTGECAGKFLKTVGWDTFWEFPKVIAPKEKIEKIEVPKVKEEIKEVLITDIFIPPDYSRVYVDPNHVNEIKTSMKESGQVDPITVVPINYVKNLEKEYGAEAKKYKYILIRGLHRIKAMQSLNQLYIRAIVKYNEYDEEDLNSLCETGLEQLSAYEQAKKVKKFRDKGYKEEEIAKRIGKTQPYVSQLLEIAKANLKKDYGDKEYVLTAFTFNALLNLAGMKTLDPKQYEFHVKKSIEEFENGRRIFSLQDLGRWSKEYVKPIEEKEKEIQRKLYGEEIPSIPTIQTQKPIESQQVQQVQLQVQKPISRIPTQEEVKEKIKEVRRKKEKTPEEKFNKKIESYKYFYGEEFDSMNAILIKYMKDHDIPFERVQKLQAYYRECNREAWKISQEKLSKEEKEELNKRFYNIAEKFFKGELK
jgi:ParB/RepB/Spo0J family partition protein